MDTLHGDQSVVVMTFIVPTNFSQLPPVWEMSQPFQVDATGEIAFDTDPYMWARNHILALLLTNPGERVMRPSYGIGILNFVFENDNPIIETQLTTAINQSLAVWEPNITIQQCQFLPEPDYSGVVNLSLAFSVGSSPSIFSMAFTISGTTVAVSS
jgi:uncharacterized protein